MEAVIFGIASGLLMGLASSLHCAAMCAGISTGILLALDKPSPAARLRVLMLAHAGRALSYVTLGTALGAAGASLIGLMPSAVAFRFLQWGSAVVMMWIGLSTAGLVPSIARADRVLAPISAAVGGVVGRAGSSPLAPLGLGVAWGFMPCAMVYGALLTATLTGSAAGGAAVMVGFALATVPGLSLASLGVRTLVTASSDGAVRTVVGLGIAAGGFATAWLAPAVASLICR